MKTLLKLIFCFGTLLPICVLSQQSPKTALAYNSQIKMGADKHHIYLPYLTNKTVAVVANQTSMVGNEHLVDFLVRNKINVKCVFSPEHGFRGNADAGEKVRDGFDAKSGLPIVSLYGSHKKPDANEMLGVDIVVFDIQDVGARFYTYISTMHYVMQACAEYQAEFLVLDRPNPNGFYVDGPVLKKEHASFVGMHPVPVVHGMTIAEYAEMINGEKWLINGMPCKLRYVAMDNYKHTDLYQVPIKPSPNLPNNAAIYLYPSLCFFEGTVVSVGRGTDKPFQVAGEPNFHKKGAFVFVPQSKDGAKKPLYEGTPCLGFDLTGDTTYILNNRILNFTYLKEFYKDANDKGKFFSDFFTKLAGNESLKEQIIQNKSEEELHKSWEEELNAFKAVRKKYLLYQDFE